MKRFIIDIEAEANRPTVLHRDLTADGSGIHDGLGWFSKIVYCQPHLGLSPLGRSGVARERQSLFCAPSRPPKTLDPQGSKEYQGGALIHGPSMVAGPLGSEWRTRRPCRETIQLPRRNDQ